MNYKISALPILVFSAILYFLYNGLYKDPTLIPSPLIGKTLPTFKSTSLIHSGDINNTDLLGKNYGDMRTATDSFNQSVKDYLIIDQVQKIDEQISALSLKKGKTPDDLNNLHILIKQREDLLTSQ